VAFVITTGCAHIIATSTDIRPMSSYGTRIRGNFGVYVPPEFETREERVTPSSYIASAHYYNFQIGPSAKSAVINGLSCAVENLVILTTPPTATVMSESKLIGYFVPQFANCALDVYFASGFLTSNAKASANISVTIKFFDASERTIFTYTASGSGASSRGADAFNAEKGFAEAAEMALRQVSEGIAQAVYSNPDIRALKEAPRDSSK
jgi:hypothetical protein